MTVPGYFQLFDGNPQYDHDAWFDIFSRAQTCRAAQNWLDILRISRRTGPCDECGIERRDTSERENSRPGNTAQVIAVSTLAQPRHVDKVLSRHRVPTFATKLSARKLLQAATALDSHPNFFLCGRDQAHDSLSHV